MTETTRNVYHVLVLCQNFSSVQEITLYLFFDKTDYLSRLYDVSKAIKPQVQNISRELFLNLILW